MPDNRTIIVGVAPDAGGFAITMNGRPARTPQGRPLVLPTESLARAVADEIAEEPKRLAGVGLADPAAAPNFRLASGMLDIMESEPGARDRIVTELAAYGGTDLTCYRAARPEALVKRQQAHWAPLLDWLEARHGARLATTTAITAVEQPRPSLDAIRSAIAAHDAPALAALSLATRAAGSIVIGLALIGGRLDPDQAFAAATVDEVFQAEQWGADPEAEARREGVRLDLRHAARFLELAAQERGET